MMPPTTPKLVAELRGVPAPRRTARFRCVLVFLDAASNARPLIAEGVWEGLILAEPRGAGGFGYDPYFFLPALGVSAAELDPRDKNRMSHRGLAMRELRRQFGAAIRVTRATAPLPPLALYVHMPWCVRKCPYCDFNSHQLTTARADGGYIDSLLDDFAREEPWLAARRVETVFFGGGTPSLFAPEDIARLLMELKRRVPFAPDAEVTLEANPGTIERGRFAGYRDAGVNRVSLGAQTFSGAALAALGRIHSPDDTLSAVAELRGAGLDNFNLDLMYALPGQSVDEALADIATACSLKPAHISHYQLTLEPGTVFHARPPASLPDEEAAWTMQTECQRILQDAGFRTVRGFGLCASRSVLPPQLELLAFRGLSWDRRPAPTASSRPASRAAFCGRRSRSSRLNIGADCSRSRMSPSANAAWFLRANFHSNSCWAPCGSMPASSRVCSRARTGLPFSQIEASLVDAETRGLVAAHDGSWRATELGRRFLNDLQAAFLP